MLICSEKIVFPQILYAGIRLTSPSTHSVSPSCYIWYNSIKYQPTNWIIQRLNKPNCFNLSYYRVPWMAPFVNSHRMCTPCCYRRFTSRILTAYITSISNFAPEFVLSSGQTEKDDLVFHDVKYPSLRQIVQLTWAARQIWPPGECYSLCLAQPSGFICT